MAVMANVYARICLEVSFRSHVELINRRKKSAPCYAAVVKAAAGHAPVPRNVWRGACAQTQ
eukprot:5072541-Karenia_brevis.AAC.1